MSDNVSPKLTVENGGALTPDQAQELKEIAAEVMATKRAEAAYDELRKLYSDLSGKLPGIANGTDKGNVKYAISRALERLQESYHWVNDAMQHLMLASTYADQAAAQKLGKGD